ncbi:MULTISPECIES: helix-turn-helix domain-containing protein [Nocardia]|uniref:helix-turn-helix domain-containing protein n=1 Tax=Nocardia TaxID=1817 RepID=UPI000BF0D195|nr:MULTISPECIES: helix-turn-helix domain-containing protein [Nocardia]PEH79410.1 hypothetical protein CRM89_28380 [Nocardia sp. FDAARGOS_372]
MTDTGAEIVEIDGHSTATRAAQWEQAISNIGIALEASVPARPRVASEHLHRHTPLDEILLVDFHCGPLTLSRTRRSIARAATDLVAVAAIRGGVEQMSQGDAGIALRPGDLAVWDTRRPVRFDFDDNVSKRVLLIPEATFKDLGVSLGPLGVVARQSGPATRLLSHFIDALTESVADLSGTALASARNATLELLSGALRPDVGASACSSVAALRATIEQWIERNLFDEITPASVAAAHAVSVRTVHRAFAESGESLGAMVRRRRIVRARAELCRTDIPVASIASRFGFADASHFSRAFKDMYGMPPATYRQRSGNAVRRGEIAFRHPRKGAAE